MKQQGAMKTTIPVPKVQVGAGKVATPPVAAVRPTLSPQKPAAEVKKPESVSSPEEKQKVNLKAETDVKDLEAKMRRAEKFNTGLSEEDKKQQRAQK